MILRFSVLLACTTWLSAGLRPAPEPPVAVPAPGPAASAPASAPAIDHFFRVLGDAAAPDAAQDGLAEFRRGLVALRAGDAATAIAAFERAARTWPGMADWAWVHAADAAALTGDVGRVRAYLGESDPDLAREWGWRAEAVALRRAGQPDRARALVERVAREAPDGVRRAEAARVLADLLLARRDSAAAYAALRRVMDEAPLSPLALEAARTLSALPRVNADDHLAIGRLYLRHGNLDRGVAGVDRFLASGRGSPEQRAAARLDVAAALFRARRYAEAQRRLVTLSNERLADSLAAEVGLLLGRTQFRQNNVTAARATLLRTAERHPDQRAAAEALYIVADLDHDRALLSGARELYTRAFAAYPRSDHAADAAMRLGGLHLAAGETRAAIRVFEEFRSHHPEGRRHLQATFWAGRAYLAAGDTALGRARLREVARTDPASFYGLRAAELIGDGPWTMALAPSPMTSDRVAREVGGAFARLDALRQLGLEEAASFEMDRIRRTLAHREGGLYSFAEGLHERGEIVTAVRLGREIQRAEGAWNARLLRIVYPFPYRDQITYQARRRGLDPFLVAGLIRQESLFDPTARSSAGAIGLMQVMPPTGRALARREGVSFQPTQLRQADFNLRLGTLYFSQLLDQYRGSVPYVLAAYNAGPSRVARWRQLPEAVDPDLFAERIPFAETRDYVKIVQQNARIYAAMYAE